MVGEVRDGETAEICLRAALTGHFVLSTIHTNDALSAVTRLGDMGIEPFLLGSTLRVLEAQRLLRKLCPHCKEAYEVDDELAELHGLKKGEVLYRPKGCLQCRRMGYRGRVGVFEIIRITPKLTQLIQKRVALDQLRKAAREEGMKMLYDSALDKVRQGITSPRSSDDLAGRLPTQVYQWSRSDERAEWRSRLAPNAARQVGVEILELFPSRPGYLPGSSNRGTPPGSRANRLRLASKHISRFASSDLPETSRRLVSCIMYDTLSQL